MKVEGWVATDRVGSRITFDVRIDDEDLEGLTGEERLKFIDDSVNDVVWRHVEWGWK